MHKNLALGDTERDHFIHLEDLILDTFQVHYSESVLEDIRGHIFVIRTEVRDLYWQISSMLDSGEIE